MLIKLENNVILKPLSYGDIDDLIETLGNSNVNKYIFFAPAPEEKYKNIYNPVVEKFEKALASNTLPEDLVFAIKTSNNEFIGELGIYTNPEAAGVYEVVYLLKEEFWGKGVATLVCQFATNFIFNTLNGHRAEASCYSNNLGSRNVLEKCGYLLEGELTSYFKTSEGTFNKVIYGKVK